jgi:PPM family protein phosphatase
LISESTREEEEMKLRDEVDTLEIAPPVSALDSNLPQTFSSLVEVDVAGRTHIGRVRESNEDNYLIARGGRSLQIMSSSILEGLPLYSEEIGYGMVVADGMGGAAGGEIASSTALIARLNLVLSTPDWILQTTGSMTQKIIDRIHKRFIEINGVVSERARDTPGLAGMGTTITVAWSIGLDLFVGHVGDSRGYLLRRGVLYRLTKDQTLAQSMIDHGIVKADENVARNFGHILTQAIGTDGARLQPEIHLSRLEDGDQILLCTDGLSDMVDVWTIAEILSQHETSAAACESLVSAALEKGGPDNITAVLARYRVPAVKARTSFHSARQIPGAEALK